MQKKNSPTDKEKRAAFTESNFAMAPVPKNLCAGKGVLRFCFNDLYESVTAGIVASPHILPAISSIGQLLERCAHASLLIQLLATGEDVTSWWGAKLPIWKYSTQVDITLLGQHLNIQRSVPLVKARTTDPTGNPSHEVAFTMKGPLSIGKVISGVLPSVGSLGLDKLTLFDVAFKKTNRGKAKAGDKYDKWAMTHFTAKTRIPGLSKARVLWELYYCTTPSEANKGNPQLCIAKGSELLQEGQAGMLVQEGSGVEASAELVMAAVKQGIGQVLPLVATQGYQKAYKYLKKKFDTFTAQDDKAAASSVLFSVTFQDVSDALPKLVGALTGKNMDIIGKIFHLKQLGFMYQTSSATFNTRNAALKGIFKRVTSVMPANPTELVCDLFRQTVLLVHHRNTGSVIASAGRLDSLYMRRMM